MSQLPTARVVDDGTYSRRFRALTDLAALLALGGTWGGCSKSHEGPRAAPNDVAKMDAAPGQEPGLERDPGLSLPDADDSSSPDADTDNDVDADIGADASVVAAACATDATCRSTERCVDGICCAKSCTGGCLSCAAAKTGQPDGVCADVLPSADPDGACATARCDTAESCRPYRCDLGGDVCLTSCRVLAECAVGHVCTADGTCEALTNPNVVWVTSWGGFSDNPIDVSQLSPLVVNGMGDATVAVRCVGTPLAPTVLDCDELGSINLVSVSPGGESHQIRSYRYGRDIWLNLMSNEELVFGLNSARPSGECCRSRVFRLYDGGAHSVEMLAVSEVLWASSDASGVTALVVAQWDSGQYGDGPPVPGPRAFLKYRPPHELFDSRPWPSDVPLKSDPSGALWYVGRGDEAASLGCPTSARADSLFAAKISSSGACLWRRDFGATVHQSAYTFDGEGALLLAATVSGSADFGVDSPAQLGPVDLVVAKLGNDGSIIWSRRFGGSSSDGDAKIATSAHGPVYVGGPFVGALDFGAGPVAADPGAHYVVKMSSAGVTLGQHQFKANGGFELAATPDGDVLVLCGDPLATGPGAGIDFGLGAVFPGGGSKGLALAKLRF